MNISFPFLQILPWEVFALICVFLLTPRTSAEDERGTFFRIEENAFLDDENILQSEKADSVLTCAQMCGREVTCKGANFLANEGTCFFLGEGRQGRKVDKFVKRDGSFYSEKVFREFLSVYSARLQSNGTNFESKIY